MNDEEFDKAAGYWIIKDADNKKIASSRLKSEIEKYISAGNVCALATGSGKFIRCTPIEYTYHDGAFWMFSEGGLKFKGLKDNKNVCLAIYDKYEGFGNLKGMQVSGTAEIVEPFSGEYLSAAEFRKIPVDALKKLSSPMHLIKVTPHEIDFLNSDFKKEGFSSRQKLEV